MDIIGHFSNKGLRNYKILEKIDEGRMSVIHRAIRLADDALVALKLLNRDAIVLRNALKKKLPDIDSKILSIEHKNVIKTFEFGGRGSRQYISIEYLHGLTLGKIAKRRLASIRQLIEYFIQVCEGLNYMHEKAGIVHRDFNPFNVIVNEKNICKIVDLDFAFERVDDTRGIFRRSGTLGYLAPEQVRGKNLDHRIDIYAIGASMYEIMTRHNPYRDTSSASTALRREKTLSNHLIVTPSAPSMHNSEIPPLLDDVILKCVQINREERYKNVAEVKRDLEKCFEKL